MRTKNSAPIDYLFDPTNLLAIRIPPPTTHSYWAKVDYLKNCSVISRSRSPICAHAWLIPRHLSPCCHHSSLAPAPSLPHVQPSFVSIADMALHPARPPPSSQPTRLSAPEHARLPSSNGPCSLLPLFAIAAEGGSGLHDNGHASTG